MDPTVDTFDPGNQIRALYRRAIDKAMGGKPDNPVKQSRYYVMHQLVESAVRRFPGGDVAEFGCWRGHSTLIIASLMQREGSLGRLHVFDSFEGLSPFGPEDKSAARKPQDTREKYATSVDAFRKMVDPLGFVRVHKGWIPDVLVDADVQTLSFANIDVNLFDPTLHALGFAYRHMLPGGIIFLDDYGYKTCPGATKAVDQFLAGAMAPAIFVALPFGSAFIVR